MLAIVREIMTRDNITDPLKFDSFTETSARLGTRTYREVTRKFKSIGPAMSLVAAKYVWTLENYRDLLTRMIFHFKGSQDDSELVWSKIVNSSDLFPAERFRKAWKKVMDVLSTKIDVSEYSFDEALGYCMDNLENMGLAEVVDE
jgi:hypothetical protein